MVHLLTMRLPCIAVLMIAACTGCPPNTASVEAHFIAQTPDDFRAAGRLLAGITPGAESTTWHRGDSVLFGLTLQRPSTTERMLLQLTVVDPELREEEANHSGNEPRRLRLRGEARVNGTPEPVLLVSKLALVEVLVTDERGAEIGRSRIPAPRDLLTTGFAPACQATEVAATQAGATNLAATGEATTTRCQIQAMLSLLALLDLVQNDATLAAILWDVVDKPSFFSVLWHLGAKAALAPAFDRIARVDWPPHLPCSGPLWSLPLALTVNGAAALHCRIAVGSSQPPLALCGGAVELQAWSPTDPARRFAMTLLAARLGLAPGDAAEPPARRT